MENSEQENIENKENNSEQVNETLKQETTESEQPPQAVEKQYKKIEAVQPQHQDFIVETPQNMMKRYAKPSKSNIVEEEILKTSEELKKIVIYIYGENIDYVSELSQDQKNKIVNEMLSIKRLQQESEREKEKRKSIFTHFFIVVITVVLFTPIFFYGINRSFELTVQNYKVSEQNFRKLYKNQDALKTKDLTKMKKVKKH